MYLKSDGRTIFTGVIPEEFAPFVIMIVCDPLNFTRDPAEVIGEEMLEGPKMIGESPMMGPSDPGHSINLIRNCI